jgi:hypothetical protein
MSFRLNSIFGKISLEQFVFDLMVILFLFLFDFLLGHSGKSIIDFLNPNTTLALIYTIQILVSFQLGRVYLRYNKKKNTKFENALLNITIFLVYLFLFIGLPSNLGEFSLLEKDPYMMFAFLGGVVALLIGSLLGFNEEKLSFLGVLSVAGFTLFILGFVYLIWLLLHFGADKDNWWLGVGIFIGGFTIEIALFVLFFRIYEFVKPRFRSRTTPKSIKMGLNALFVALAALSIMIWQSVHIFGQEHFSLKSHGAVDYDYILFSLFLTGILPFRFMLAIAPPRKLFSLVSAVLIIMLDVYAIANH